MNSTFLPREDTIHKLQQLPIALSRAPRTRIPEHSLISVRPCTRPHLAPISIQDLDAGPERESYWFQWRQVRPEPESHLRKYVWLDVVAQCLNFGKALIKPRHPPHASEASCLRPLDSAPAPRSQHSCPFARPVPFVSVGPTSESVFSQTVPRR